MQLRPDNYITSSILFILLSILPVQYTNAHELELGVGLYMKPEYQGANEYQAVLLPSVKTSWRSVGIALRGAELQLDLVPSPKLNLGVLVRYDEGRSGSVSDNKVRLMHTIDDALEFGVFMQSGIPVSMLGLDDPALIIGTLDVTSAFGSGHGGTLLSANLGVLRNINSNTTIVSRFLLSYADSDYKNAYFGVNQMDSELTSLAEFRTGAGIKDFGMDLILNKRFDSHWSGGLLVNYKRFTTSLAYSPVISDRGMDKQWNTGVFANYLF